MAAEGDDSVLCGSRGLITCAQFVVLQTQLNKKARESGREREEARVRKREMESGRAHTFALSRSHGRARSRSHSLALSPSLGLLSIRKTSKSQLETGKQPPESCPAQHGANVSDIGDKPAAFFFAKKLNGNGACGWSVRSRPRPRRGRGRGA